MIINDWWPSDKPVQCLECTQGLKGMPDNSVDAVVTDPPYELGFMGKEWDKSGIAYNVEMWKEVLRVLKPGGHLLSFGGSRTYHRMACAIEDAGFSIRDQIMWVYGCLSEDTEILTTNGWERYDRYKQLNTALPILIYDVISGLFKWETPNKWNEYYVEQDTVYRIRSNNTDQIVSRGHRCIVEREGELVFCRSEELQSKENIPFLEGMPNVPLTISVIHEGASITEQGLSCMYKSEGREVEYGKEIPDENKMPDVQRDVLSSISEQEQAEEILFTAMCGEGEGLAQEVFSERQGKKEPEQGFKDGKEPCLERGSDLLQNTRELCVREVCAMPTGIHGDGKEGRLCNGASVDCGTEHRALPIENRGCSSHRPRPHEQQDREPDALREQSNTQGVRRYRITEAEVTKEKYTGIIFCPTVSTGAFVARRNGKIFITGNSGFPKSMDVSKAIDKQAGVEREVVGIKPGHEEFANRKTKGHIDFKDGTDGFDRPWMHDNKSREKYHQLTVTTTPEAKQWEGFGTALKPAHEPIVYATKPLNTVNHITLLCQLIEYVQRVERILKHIQAGLQEGKEHIVVENVQTPQEEERTNSMGTGRAECSNEAMDISQLELKAVNTALNTILLWKNILEELYKETNKSTISMENEMITELKILNWLIGQVTYQNIIQAQEYKANGSELDVRIVESILKKEEKKLGDILNIIVQETALRNITYASNVESGLIQITNIVNIALLNVIIKTIQESPQKELNIFVQYAERCFKQFLVGNQNIVEEIACQKRFEPNHEPIVLARKPLSEKTVAENVLKWGTGALNIDASRIPFASDDDKEESITKNQHADFNSNGGIRVPTKGIYHGDNRPPENYTGSKGRWPANFVHDGSEEVVSLFPNSTVTGKRTAESKSRASFSSPLPLSGKTNRKETEYTDSGSAARFFYCAKASKSERNEGCESLDEIVCGIGDERPSGQSMQRLDGREPRKSRNNHPTVKPITLMKYLIKLVTPPGGIVLDPFMGSGSTGVAGVNLGVVVIGFEMDEHNCDIALARIDNAKRTTNKIKSKTKRSLQDIKPLEEKVIAEARIRHAHEPKVKKKVTNTNKIEDDNLSTLDDFEV